MSESESKGTRAVSMWVAVAAFVAGVVLAVLVLRALPTTQGSAGSASSATSAEAAGATSTDASSATPSPSSADAASTLSSGASMAETAATYFPSWNPQSPALAQLVSFVDEVTNPASADYVDPEARVATFDMDGTFISEKAPVAIGFCLLFHRVLDDPSYQAPPEMRELVEQARAEANQGIMSEERSDKLNRFYPQAFAGMGQAEFHAYVQQFLDTVPVGGFEGMTYGGSFYQPMLEVIRYLQDHDFEVYIVSGSSRESVRAICVPLGIAPDHIIGTDIALVATGQGDQDGASYTFVPADKLLTGTNMYDECLKTNKVIRIATEIGRRPILSFGNSSGDYAMLNYAQSNPEHRGMGFLVVCDDTEREYGSEEKAASYWETVKTGGWAGISMRDDWATIYGEGVKKTALNAEAQQEPAQAA